MCPHSRVKVMKQSLCLTNKVHIRPPAVVWPDTKKLFSYKWNLTKYFFQNLIKVYVCDCTVHWSIRFDLRLTLRPLYVLEKINFSAITSSVSGRVNLIHNMVCIQVISYLTMWLQMNILPFISCYHSIFTYFLFVTVVEF